MKKDNLILFISLVITGVLIAVIGNFWVIPKLNPSPTNTSVNNHNSSIATQKQLKKAVTDRISFGNQTLIAEKKQAKNQTFKISKKQAIESFQAGDYQSAIDYFEKAINQSKNSPATLIYLNNARAELAGKSNYYTIAVAAPIGNDLDTALKVLRGVAQVQEEVYQQGGIQGKYLKVVIANDDDDPDLARQIAQELAANAEILGVIGHYSSSTSLAAAEVYKSQNLVSISGTSTSTQLSNFSDYFFRTVPNDSLAVGTLANYMSTGLKKQKAAIFYDPKDAYSNSLKKAFTIALSFGGGELVSEFDVSENFDAFDSVKQAKQAEAEVLMLAVPNQFLSKAIQVINVNNNDLPILGGDTTYHINVLKLSGEDAVGMVTGVAWHIDGDINASFPQSSRRLWGADVDWNTAMTYDAAQALVSALAQNNTRKGVQKTLTSPDFSAPGVSGEIKFSSSGDRNSSVQLVEVRAVANSRSGTGYDFVPFN